jgi:hypothetical protein
MQSLRKTSVGTRVSVTAAGAEKRVRELYVVIEAYQALLGAKGFPSKLEVDDDPFTTTKAGVGLYSARLTIDYAPAAKKEEKDPSVSSVPSSKVAATATASAPVPAAAPTEVASKFVVDMPSGVTNDLNDGALHKISHGNLLSALRGAISSNMEGRDAEDPSWGKFTQILLRGIPDHESPYQRVKDIMLADSIRKAGLTPCVKVTPEVTRTALDGSVRRGSEINIIIGSASEKLSSAIFREFDMKNMRGKGNEAVLEAQHRVNPEIEPCYLHMMILAYLGANIPKEGSKASQMQAFLTSRMIG